MSRILRSFRSVALLAAFAGVGACSVTSEPPVPRAATITSGNRQTQPAGTVFPVPLGLIVVDQYDYGARNVPVTWTIVSGGGSLSTTSNTTSDAGVASTVYTAGPTPGPVTITADIAGVGTLTFNETVS